MENFEVTESKIKLCSDPFQLKEWKLLLIRKSASIKDKLTAIKINRRKGIQTDFETFRKNEAYKKMIGILLVMVQLRQSEINIIIKEKNRIKSAEEDKILIGIFKEQLTETTYKNIIEIFHNRIDR